MDHVLVSGSRLEVRWWNRDVHPAVAPIVLLHEGLGSVPGWKDFPAALAARTHRAVFAYSRRGYGRSDPRGAPLTTRFMHDEAVHTLPQVLDAAGIDHAVLLGHSDGGSIALLAAAAWPARIDALVLEAPHVFVEPLSIASIRRMRELYATTNMRERLARHHVHVDEAFRGWNDVWLDPAFARWNIEAELPRVRCPTRVLQGADDEYGTWAQALAIMRLVAGPVQARLIQNCGHSPHRDHPSVVLDEVVLGLA
jgi:pimeloyl-ACP methyl ester carboxylesterase